MATLMLTPKCQQWLGKIALTSIERHFLGQDLPRPEEGEEFSAEERALLYIKAGAFVTLTIAKNLRGCIGAIVGYEPLVQNVWRMAEQAAFHDPRFPPLSAKEWPNTHLEISVLSEAVLCPDVNAIEIGRHGLILQYAGHTGVFLPQVPVEQGWNREEYLEHLCRKAGVAQGSWQAEGARIFWYEAFVFPVQRPS